MGTWGPLLIAGAIALLAQPGFWFCVVALACASMIGDAVWRASSAHSTAAESITDALKEQAQARTAQLRELYQLLDERLPGKRPETSGSDGDEDDDWTALENRDLAYYERKLAQIDTIRDSNERDWNLKTDAP